MQENSSIDEIREWLKTLKKGLIDPYFIIKIGIYSIRIFTHRIQDQPYGDDDLITNHEVVDVYVYQGDDLCSISLTRDGRFKDYEPIRYRVLKTPNGTVNLSSGGEMPITQLCELIRYIYRLDRLTPFL